MDISYVYFFTLKSMNESKLKGNPRLFADTVYKRYGILSSFSTFGSEGI